MRLSIQRQVTAGNLAPATATELYNKVDEIAEKVNDGNAQEAKKKVSELRDNLAKLVEDGKLTPTGYQVLLRDLDRIDGSLPAVS
jgi:hypothetical protein